ncbi:MAG: DUF542 domain-containing protein [Bacteroidota bacterium]
MTLSEIAIHVPGAIELFEKYDFNYYQYGKKTFKEACAEKGLDYTELDNELNQQQKLSKNESKLTLEDMSIDRLIDFINGQHHSNEDEVLESLDNSIKNLISNSDVDRSLIMTLEKVDEKFNDFKIKLTEHCRKEDKLLFPYMRKLYESRLDKDVPAKKTFISNPIHLLETEHIQAATILSEIKDITQGFSGQVNAPKEYLNLMERFREFEKEFHVHLHIENNILFPKVIELEKQLKGNNQNSYEASDRKI